MPAKSQRQARAMRAAAHGSQNAVAKRIRASMTPSQIRDFERVSPSDAKRRFQTEHARYDSRSRNNLKRGR